jgi:hypothetical protein
LLKNKFVENGNKVLAGQPLFVDVAATAGVEGRIFPPLGTLPARRGKTAGWFDYDRTFSEVPGAGGLIGLTARGAIPADYDRDGDLDLALVNEDGPIELFKNISTNMGNWVQFRLKGVQSNKLGIGAVIKIVAGPKNMMRQVKGGNSAHSQDSGVQHFGLGGVSVLTSVQVLWPSGVVDVLSNITVNRFITIVEGSTGTSTSFDMAPPAFDLAQNSPNPFGPHTAIRFSLAKAASINVAVYDAEGERVATLANGSRAAGQHSVDWDGTDENGRHVSPGVYFYELRAPGAHIAKKMLLMH